MGKINKFIKSTLFGLILSIVHIVLTFILLIYVLKLNMIPAKFFIPACFVLLLLCALAFLMAFAKKIRPVGKIISLLMIIISALGVYYVSIASDTFDKLSGANKKVDVVNVYVMKANPADDIADLKNSTFGVLAVLDKENTDKTVKSIESQLKTTIDKEEFEGYVQMAQALYDGEVDAIILNQAYISSLIENEEFENFETLTKILHNESHETIIDVDNDLDVKNKPFAMFLSGIDIEGKITYTSRSDVNIIAIINPATRQVLLLNTPRDYYVELSNSNGMCDKLTHAGIYGVDVSMKTLEMLYDIKLDYFFRINFTGFKELIDALGGVRVYSDFAFTARHGGFKFVKGYNSMNGEQALGFVRERYAFTEGDNQRGKNQMALIEGVADAAMSSAILTNFSQIMGSLEGSFETSMSSDQIASLVKKQLDQGGSWNIVSYAVSGDGAKMPVYSMSSIPYVTIPDYDTVDIAKELIQMVYDGKTISDAVIRQLESNKDDSSSVDSDVE